MRGAVCSGIFEFGFIIALWGAALLGGFYACFAAQQIVHRELWDWSFAAGTVLWILLVAARQVLRALRGGCEPHSAALHAGAVTAGVLAAGLTALYHLNKASAFLALMAAGALALSGSLLMVAAEPEDPR